MNFSCRVPLLDAASTATRYKIRGVDVKCVTLNLSYGGLHRKFVDSFRRLCDF